LFISQLKPSIIFKGIVKYPFHLINTLLRGRRSARFLSLLPLFFTNQIIYYKKKRSFLILKIRSYVDFMTFRQIFQGNDYGLEKITRRQDLISQYQKIIDSGKTPLIIDCGGNIGMASKYFNNEYPDAHIICIEPDHLNIEQAKINNKTDKVHFLEKAIGCRDEKGIVIDPGLGEWGYRMEISQDGNTEVVSINSVLNKYPQDKYSPFIVKIDIEGFEANLFSENTDWVEKFPLLIIELHDWMLPKSANSSNFLKTIAPMDRDFVFYGENIFSIDNKSPY